MADAEHQVVRHERHGAVLVLIMDAPPVNALSQHLRAGLWAGIEAAEADAEVKAVVIRADGRTFPAGADITEFGKPPQAPILTDLCNFIELCSKPVVAALHGTALGGGFELALAAHARVARADAKVGLPEVTLGVLPGAGGTQRVPRLIGAEQALRLMLGGKLVPAVEALALGLLDHVVEDGLEAEALAMAEAMIGTAPVPTRDRRDGLRDGLAYQAAVSGARTRLKGGRLPAPPRIVECVEAAQLLPFEQGLAFERAAFLELVTTPEALGLRHAFFAERVAGRMPESRETPRPLRQLAVMGAAGADLVMMLLMAGYPVTLVEGNRPALVAALERIAAAQEQLSVAGKLSEAARDADWARLTPSLGAAPLVDVDLVLVAESSGMAEAIAATPAGRVLVLTGRGALTEGARAADILGLRLAQGPSKLAEVVVGAKTAPDAVATVLAMLRKLGRVTIRSANPGNVGGRVAVAGRAAMAHLIGAGYPAEDVAVALAEFGLESLAGPLPDRPHKVAAAPEIVARVLGAMANEGARLLGRGIAQRPSDVDLALIMGYGFPRWEGGPLHWADRRGLLVVRNDLRHWANESAELWTPAPLFDELIANGQRLSELNAV